MCGACGWGRGVGRGGQKQNKTKQWLDSKVEVCHEVMLYFTVNQQITFLSLFFEKKKGFCATVFLFISRIFCQFRGCLCYVALLALCPGAPQTNTSLPNDARLAFVPMWAQRGAQKRGGIVVLQRETPPRSGATKTLQQNCVALRCVILALDNIFKADICIISYLCYTLK